MPAAHGEALAGATARRVTTDLADGLSADGCKNPAQPFRTHYTQKDSLLHGTLSGPATAALLRCAIEFFESARCMRLVETSNGHMYNVRRSRAYAGCPAATSQR